MMGDLRDLLDFVPDELRSALDDAVKHRASADCTELQPGVYLVTWVARLGEMDHPAAELAEDGHYRYMVLNFHNVPRDLSGIAVFQRGKVAFHPALSSDQFSPLFDLRRLEVPGFDPHLHTKVRASRDSALLKVVSDAQPGDEEVRTTARCSAGRKNRICTSTFRVRVGSRAVAVSSAPLHAAGDRGTVPDVPCAEPSMSQADATASPMAERIVRLLSNYYKKPDQELEGQFDQEYQATMSGGAKGREVAAFLTGIGGLDVSRVAYVSIGGGDGSEIKECMSAIPVRHAILVEPSDDGFAKAQKLEKDLARAGRTLTILHGDATGRLGDCTKKLEEWRTSRKVDAVLLSLHSVLHELPSRSPGYDPLELVAGVYKPFSRDARLFYCREPCSPHGWPSRITFRLKGVDSDTLNAIASHINDVLRINGAPKALTDGWVKASTRLAAECLLKVLFCQNAVRYRYECQECLTSFDPYRYRSGVLRRYLPDERIQITPMVSDTLRSLYRRNGVECQKIDGTPLDMPQLFVKITAHDK